MATLDIVNAENEKVGTLDLSDEIFGARPKLDVVWASVVRDNAAARRGTHATKNRALVSGSGRKPWRQKGTGRARVGEIRNPLWRKGGTVFGPQPRSYEFSIPRKLQRSAIVAALAQKLQDGALVVIDQLAADANVNKTKAAAEMVSRWQVGKKDRDAKTLLIDVTPDTRFERLVRNITGVKIVASSRVRARDIMDTRRVVVTKAAIERLAAIG